MTDIVLGILMCPVFNDELVHNLIGDADIDKIIVLTNQFTNELCDKLNASGLRYESIPESDFSQSELNKSISGYTVLIRTNNLGLHGNPSALKDMIEAQIGEMQPYIDVLGVYYCQCGNADWDVSEWCDSNGYKPTFTYRGNDGKVCYDCVCVAFGSISGYMAMREKYGSIFYLTPAIAYHLEDFAASGAMGFTLDSISEEIREKFGIRTDLDIIRWLVKQGSIEQSLMIDTGLVDHADFEKTFLKRSDQLGLRPIRIEDGLVSLDAVDSIYTKCKMAINDLTMR